MLASTSNLWTFACELYSRPKVASTCLALQDRYAIDIPLLIFCCWTGRRYGELSLRHLQQALTFSKAWSAYTAQPLRSVRREMKGGYRMEWPIAETDWNDLREQVKVLELQSEKLMLEGLDRSLEGLPDSGGKGSASAAIKHIKFCFPIDLDDKVAELLFLVLKEVFNGDEADLAELADKVSP